VRDVPNTGGSWQEARGLVDAPPAAVHAWIRDFGRWPEYFGDVKTAIVLGREEGGGATLVRLRSRIFNTWLTIKIVRAPFGYSYHGRAGSITTDGQVWITDAGNGRTDVVIQNVAHVSGLLGALAPRAKIRDRQRMKLRTDLTDLQRRAHTTAATTRAATPQ
jgi:hypothetical protein